MDKRPIALCKAWRGKEFVIPAIESIYSHVEKIVFVHSEISWRGETGNDVKPIIEGWAKSNDTENKIINLDFNSKDQMKQYDFGLDYIKQNFDNDLVLFFDTDEVWDDFKLEMLLKMADFNPDYNCYSCGMHIYVKSPFYRVSPPDQVHPVVLYRIKTDSFVGQRGCATQWRFDIKGIRFHHFAYVRENTDVLLQKILNTYAAESCYSHVDLNEWIKEKYNKLPNATKFHTAKGYERFWKGVEIVGLNDLPISVRESEIVKKWMI